MSYLTLNEENNDQDNPQQPHVDVERMTRLSFEVHPSLVLDDLFLEMVAGMELEGGQDILGHPRLEDTHKDSANSSSRQ